MFLNLRENDVLLVPFVFLFVLLVKVCKLLIVFSFLLKLFFCNHISLFNFLLYINFCFLLHFNFGSSLLLHLLLQSNSILFLFLEKWCSFLPFLFLSALICFNSKCCILRLFLLLIDLKLLKLLPVHLNELNLLLFSPLFCNFIVSFNFSLLFYS